MRSPISVIGLVVVLGAGQAAAQSLGQVAAEEAARRKAIASPARVMGDADLRPDYPVTSPTDVPAWPDDSAPADPSAPRRLVEAASLDGGPLPVVPVMAVAGGEVYLEVTVNAEGRVAEIAPFRDTPPFTESLSAAVKAWSFEPAKDAAIPPAGRPVDPRTVRAAASKVLVVGLFRPPAIFSATLGEPPKDVDAPSPEVPAPVGPARMPDYPLNALFDGTVMVELQIGVDGSVMRRRLMKSSPAFDGPALLAADALSFRPARVRGIAVPSVAYVVMAFRQPITQ